MRSSERFEVEPLDCATARGGDRGVSRARVRLAAAMLTVCCLCWGLSFPVMQFASTAFERALQQGGVSVSTHMTFAMHATFNAWRFALAAGLYWLLTRKRQRGHRLVDWQAGVIVGLFSGVGMFLQLAGLRYTLPSVSGFLTALAVVFAPLAQLLVFHKPVGGRTWLAVGVAVVGMLILSQANPGASAANTMAQSPPFPHLGEIVTVVASVLFTGHIMSVDHFGSRVDAARLTCVMLAVVSMVNAGIGLAMGAADLYRAAVLGLLVRDPVFIASIASLIVISTVVAMHLMNTYQPLVSAATAAVVYCLEPVFATAWSIGLRTETLTMITVGGGAVILVAVWIVVRRPGREG